MQGQSYLVKTVPVPYDARSKMFLATKDSPENPLSRLLRGGGGVHDEIGHRRHEEEALPDFLARSLSAAAAISAAEREATSLSSGVA